LRDPDFIKPESEAASVVSVICSREKGLKLGDISDAFEEYKPRLPEGHPALEMLLERFDEVEVDAETDALERMQQATLPSEAEAALKEVLLAHRAPGERPGGGKIFEKVTERIDKLRLAHERLMLERLPIVGTQEAFAAMIAEVEREFVGARTMVRGQLRAGRNQHKARVELELQTMYGWPPSGPGWRLRRAGRQYVAELGADHPLVGDFVMAARRHAKAKDAAVLEELAPLETEVLRLRGFVEANPPFPKLMRDGYKSELSEKVTEALTRLESWCDVIGEDSLIYLRLLRSFMGVPAFMDHCQAHATELAEDLRALGPRPPPHLEEADVTEARAVAATSLAHWLECLEADDHQAHQAQAAPFRSEFASELRRVEGAVALFRDNDRAKEEDAQEGWHRPPDFESIEQSVPQEEPPPPEPEPDPVRMARELPSMRPSMGLKMRLHGVSFKDVNRSHELLVLERCADIIAKECGIPREWIANLAFSDPAAESEEFQSEVSKEIPSTDFDADDL
jgi:hypothetical protein